MTTGCERYDGGGSCSGEVSVHAPDELGCLGDPQSVAPLGVQQLGDQGRPTRLVARADAPSTVAVEVLVERDQVTPVRIGLELLLLSEDRPPPDAVAQEDAREAPRQLHRDAIQGQELSGAGRAFDQEVV